MQHFRFIRSSLPTHPRRQHSCNTVLQGDCINVMRTLPSGLVDFVLTDPPYLVRYCDRLDRRVANDNDPHWLKPAFAEMHRLLKPNAFCVSFYGWNKVDLFFDAWRAAGFRIVGHLVFRKAYASSQAFLRYEHEAAYLLTKGNPARPAQPLSDVRNWHYTGNRLHPTQKPVSVLKPLIGAFCAPGGLVFDPFCGSGSTLVAAHQIERRYLGIELELEHCRTAISRLESVGKGDQDGFAA